MREIKFEFIFENGAKGIYTLDDMTDSDGAINFAPIKCKRQYTGLKDKNGVEIYEGDILKTACMDSFKDSVGIVEYDYGLFCIRANKSKVKRPINTTLSKDLVLPFVEADTYCGFEVIGNIYENPELLENK